ncbi:MAG: hypothetical protein JXL67_13975 [Calditrichaeota bacterium]|nr:hypothetical protein [Calditrichota bacterium]
MRKLYYLKPNIQHAFTTAFTLLTAVEIVTFGILILILEHLNVHEAYDVQLYFRSGAAFFLVLLFSGFNFWYGMRLSHRIVGPMIQIQRILERAMKNEYKSRIKLRSNDYLHEIGDSLNMLLEKLDDNSDQENKKLINQREQDKEKNL